MFPDFSKVTEVLQKIDVEKLKSIVAEHGPKALQELENVRDTLESIDNGIQALVEAYQFQAFVGLLPMYMDANRNYDAQGHAQGFAVLVEAFRRSGEIMEPEKSVDINE